MIPSATALRPWVSREPSPVLCLHVSVPAAAPLYDERTQIVNGDKDVALPEGTEAPTGDAGARYRSCWLAEWPLHEKRCICDVHAHCS